RYRWHYPWLLCWAATGCFFVIDLAFFSSNLLKLFQGGWFPLAIGSVVFLLMMTWRRGRQLLHDRLQSESIELSGFMSALAEHPPQRVAGTAIFLSGEPGTVPSALLHNLKHNKVLHAQNLFVTVRNHEVPWVGMEKRVQAESLGGHCWQVTVHYGFKNEPDLPKALAHLSGLGYPLDPMGTSYFVSRDAVIPGMRQGMAPWREKLFAQMHRNASRVSDFLRLPSNSVVELGSKIEL
ncbi:MAG: KUP/HAK/KT family potassium transporter, partial [Comamonas sp.]